MEYYDLNGREFMISNLKKNLNNIQENSEHEFNELRNEINEQKRYFTKKTETIKKNQPEILELGKSINEMKNEL